MQRSWGGEGGQVMDLVNICGMNGPEQQSSEMHLRPSFNYRRGYVEVSGVVWYNFLLLEKEWEEIKKQKNL